MAKIRTVKTGSGATAVQIVRYKNNKRTILKHIGSAATVKELDELLTYANQWIAANFGQLTLFESQIAQTIFYM
jgi:hypothetical protein